MSSIENVGLAPESAESVDWHRYDFVDLGCGDGGSIRFCQKRFGAGRGIGIDLDPAKVAKARTAGVDAFQADATQLGGEKQVAFVSMMDFLEHLPSLEVAEEVIRSASAIATDFLFISHPSFEGEEYLETIGLRQYWWHWSGHRNHLHVSDYCTIFDRLGLRQYLIRYREPILDSMHCSILTSDMPTNQHEFDPTKHRPKPYVRFAQPLWRGQHIYVALRAFAPDEWTGITRSE